MKLILFSLLTVTAIRVFPQNVKEKELKTTLNEATVFLDGAQLFESGTASIGAEKTLLTIKNLSPYVNEKSIQVKAEGDFTILFVNRKFNYLSSPKKSLAIDSLTKLQDEIQNKLALKTARLDILTEKQTLLDENRNLGGKSSGATMAELKLAMDFYDAQLTKIKEEENEIKKELTLKRVEQDQISKQLKELQDRAGQPTSEIEILVRADHAVQAKFSVTYLVSNAGWFPKYDIRVKNINSPLQLTYKAEIFQNTGVDWKNIKLRFSNGAPNQNGMVPELHPWLMNYERYTVLNRSAFLNSNYTGAVRGIIVDDEGAPLPGVNVIIKGTTVGTTTDANGNYSLTLPGNDATLVFSFIGYVTQEIAATKPEINISLKPDVTSLNEAVVVGYGTNDPSTALQGSTPGIRIRGINSISNNEPTPVPSTFIENQTTVEIEVKEPYTIKSGGEKLLVDLKQYDIPAEFEYYAVPKVDNDAFLMARIVQWDQYNLLEGEANLYFEDAFIGRSILNAKALTDTLSISLGRDKSIVIGRTKIDQYNHRRTIGSNQTDTRGFKIVVKNKKSQAIKLTLFDQLPVSVNSDITVNPVELSGAVHEEKTGKLTWQQTLDPQQQKELTLQYEVKYPKRESVMLE